MRLTEVLGGTAFFESVVDAVIHGENDDNENKDPPESDDSFDEDETYSDKYVEEPLYEDITEDYEDVFDSDEMQGEDRNEDVEDYEDVFDSDEMRGGEYVEEPEDEPESTIEGGEDRENEIIFENEVNEEENTDIFEESGGEGKHAKIEDISNLLKKMINDYASKDT